MDIENLIITKELFDKLFPIGYQIIVQKNVVFTPLYGEWKKIKENYFINIYIRIS